MQDRSLALMIYSALFDSIDNFGNLYLVPGCNFLYGNFQYELKIKIYEDKESKFLRWYQW